MAAQENDVIDFEMEAPVIELKMKGTGKVELCVDGKSLTDDIPGASVSADGTVKIGGRDAGELDDPSVAEQLGAKLQSWFPPGNVTHVHSVQEFDEKKAQGLAVGKFSAEWCGPCKMAAPKVDKLSLEYPNVTFLHVDGDEIKQLMRREGANCYPTFFFYRNGSKTSDKVEGADVSKVEQIIKKMGATKVEQKRAAVEPENVTINIKRDVFQLKKTSAGVEMWVDGKIAIPAGKCPTIKVNEETRKVSIGRRGGVIYDGGDYNVQQIMNDIKAMFPTKVVHVHTTEQFDDILQKNAKVVAKFSADWCGPCHAVAPAYTELSNKTSGVVFLHVDVDECKEVSTREGIQAMPTFHFYVNGKKDSSKMVRGANIERVKTVVASL